MAEKKTSLRVLYTINSSVQYILARSYAPVSVAVIPPVEDDNSVLSSTVSKLEPLYASVSLKTCLDTICRSSPELTIVGNTRDFSVYVLDPLESNSAPPPVCITNPNGDTIPSASPPDHPRGVAVGLGLMSWALMEDEKEQATVVGTLVKQGTRQEALEVIFSLRETAGMKKPHWGTSLTSSQPPSSQESVSSFSSSQGEVSTSNLEGSSSSRQSVAPSIPSHPNPSCHDEATRETLASIQQRSRPKTKPLKTVRPSTVPVTGSDKLMDADTYIGPTKKKGRPKTTNAEPKPSPFRHNAIASGSGSIKPEVIVIDSDGEGEGRAPVLTPGVQPSSSEVTAISTKSKRSRQHPVTPPFTTDPLVRCSLQPSEIFVQVKIEPEESVLDLRPLLLSNHGVTPENFEYLSILSSMDSADPHFFDKRCQDPGVAYLLKQFVANFRATHAASMTVASVSTLSAPPPSSRSPQERRGSSSSSQSDIIILDKENVDPVAFKKPAGKDSYDGVFSDPAIPTVPLSRQNSRSDRSKGLGGTSRSNGLQSAMVSTNQPTQTSRFGRKRTLSDTMDEKERRNKGKQRDRGVRRDDHRYSSSQLPQPSACTDALRHYPRFRDSDQPRVEQPSNYYRTPLESWTSPPRLSPEGDHEAENASRELSRCTSPIRPPAPQLPRVSASSPVRAPRQNIRKGYSVPAWAVTDTATQPRLSEDAQRSLAELAEKKKQEKRERSKLKRNRSSSVVQASMRPPDPPVPRVPKPAEPLRGPIAASNAGPLIASTTIVFPIIASSRPSSPPPNPITIPKTPKTPMRTRSVRATPGGENDSLFTPGPASGSLFGSAYCRHSPQGSPPSYLTSPLGNRKKQRLSSSSDRSPKPLTYLADFEDQQKMKPTPEREAEDALDDLACPPDSLPIASSDIDIDVPQQTSVDEQTSVDDDLDPTTPVKQHWPGLPPSSPPPPSSPMLQPESDDEMAEVPIATSDSEADADMSNFEWDATSPTGNSPPYSNDQLTIPMDNEIFSFFSTDGPYQSLDQHIAFPSMDLFEQYTHLNAQSDDLQAFAVPADSNLGEALGNGLGSLDFSEVFNIIGPLVENNIHQPPQSTNDDLSPLAEGNNNCLPPFGEVDIDHAKFSADMHALLGGCVL
ncbi:unnamed protein product [Cyclocybe aegerita]|uniref:Ams2/SPT21 N-terminal domain-containing protein n=1 Tax=Cyclocybe aegerita TaxID=1973307 RepID=A0A8S0WCL7_CYCAE|nr:unnamed protein product [Cyclocybe aegerita]